MIRNPWIIDVASGRPVWLQWRDWVLSAVVWIAYAYLIREVFIDIYLIGRGAFDWMFEQAPAPDVSKMFRFMYALGIYAIVVVLNGAILIGWATYNQLRFRGSDVRKALGSVTTDQLGELYGFPRETVAEWQQSGSLVMVHDAHGKLLSVMMPEAAGMPGQPPAGPPIGTTKSQAAE